MSWDISLEKEKLMVDTIDVGNYTYNVMPMYEKALGVQSLTEFLQGKKVSEVIQPLMKGIREMEAHPEEYKKLNPENGWGNYEGALNFLKTIVSKCVLKSDYTIKVNQGNKRKQNGRKRKQSRPQDRI